jgi:hypothetical protein
MNNRSSVPSCPKCEDQFWSYTEDWAGTITYSVGDDGWEEVDRAGQVEKSLWWIRCIGCDSMWTSDDTSDEGLALRDALIALR